MVAEIAAAEQPNTLAKDMRSSPYSSGILARSQTFTAIPKGPTRRAGAIAADEKKKLALAEDEAATKLQAVRRGQVARRAAAAQATTRVNGGEPRVSLV